MNLFTVDQITNVEIFRKQIEKYAEENNINGHLEIERKWLLKTNDFTNIPVEKIGHFTILQSYLSLDPEIRIRSIGEVPTYTDIPTNIHYYITVKTGSGLIRDEYEVETSMKTVMAVTKYLNLQNINPYRGYIAIKKDFEKYKLSDGNELVIAKVDDDNNFIYGEIEFPNEISAVEYALPDYMKPLVISDVTYDEKYKMKNYWKRTRLRK